MVLDLGHGKPPYDDLDDDDDCFCNKGISHDAGNIHSAEREFHMEQGDRLHYNIQPLLPQGHRSHGLEYRAPPQQSQRGGRGGMGAGGRGRGIGGPGVYDGSGPGQGAEEDVNFSMLS